MEPVLILFPKHDDSPEVPTCPTAAGSRTPDWTRPSFKSDDPVSLNLDALIDGAFRHNASDIHMVQDSLVYLRIDGLMRPVQSSVTTTIDDIQNFLEKIMPENIRVILEKQRCVDFSWQPDHLMHFRVSVYYERTRLRLVMRLIKMEIAGIEELGLPGIISEIADHQRGIVLMTGVTGSGKSTTLAAMNRRINENACRCIITIEDPVEMVHPNIKSLVSQREIDRDVGGFRQGLVEALRQDPDVILIGEMRDPETISTAMRAAKTGHLVFSTLHTSNSIHTLERILGEFSESEHTILREQLANNLKASITQRLVRKTEGRGRMAALEIMIVNGSIQKLLLDNDIHSITTIIRQRKEGMMLFDQHLADLVRDKKIEEDEAYLYVEDPPAFRRHVKGRMATADMGGITG
jgi:twitching motility protein PilT